MATLPLLEALLELDLSPQPARSNPRTKKQEHVDFIKGNLTPAPRKPSTSYKVINLCDGSDSSLKIKEPGKTLPGVK